MKGQPIGLSCTDNPDAANLTIALCRSSRDSEFSLQDDGLLHIGHHTFTYSQYCLQVGSGSFDNASLLSQELFT